MRGFGVHASKIEIVPNGVDDFFTPGDERAKSDYILFTGTLEPRKGIDDLIDAWRALARPRPRLVLCGDAGWGTRIDEEEGIERTGYVTRERLRELYRRALRLRLSVASRRLRHPAARSDGLRRAGDRDAHRRDSRLRGRRGAARRARRIATRCATRSRASCAIDRCARELRARGPERARSWRWERGASVMSDLIRAV